MSFDLDTCWKSVQHGDKKAFETLYRRLHPGLCFYAEQLTGDSFAGEEIVQDVFLKLWQNRHTFFSKGGSIRSYIYQSVHNQSINYLIHRKTRKQAFLSLASAKWWYEIGEQFAFDDQLIEALQAAETQYRINILVETLSEQCRQIFKMSRFEEKTNEEIASLLNISVNTVKTQIYRALKKIREELE